MTKKYSAAENERAAIYYKLAGKILKIFRIKISKGKNLFPCLSY